MFYVFKNGVQCFRIAAPHRSPISASFISVPPNAAFGVTNDPFGVSNGVFGIPNAALDAQNSASGVMHSPCGARGSTEFFERTRHRGKAAVPNYPNVRVF